MQSLTPIQQEIIQALSSGLSVTAAAAQAGVHRTTVHHWCRTIPAFRDTVTAARQAAVDDIRDQLHTLVAPAIALLRRIALDESASPSLRVRVALAILNFTTAPQELPVLKGHAAPSAHLDAASEAAIHQNSSLSSLSSSDENAAPSQSQTPRNAPCPCGSKQKYKRCCGRNAPPVLNRAA